MPVKSKPTPIVKWVGGKRQLQSQILKSFELANFDSDNKTYFEPFFGGGAILFALQPRNAVINDLNSKLINLYQQVRNDVEGLIRIAGDLRDEYNLKSADLESQRSFYLEKRKSFNEVSESGLSQAALFLFLNKAGFNGMYRENSRGEFNIPFGKKSTLKVFEEENLKAVSAILQQVEILNGDFASAVENSAQPGDLVYFDPPYVPLTATASFTSYTKDGFELHMQKKLAQLANELTERGVKVAISNSSEARGLYDPYFKGEPLQASRMLAANPASRADVTELLFTNFEHVNG